jgi:hypothetical protein
MKNRERRANVAMVSKRRQQQDELGRFLESLPIQAVAHLTFPRPVTEVERDGMFTQWINEIQRLAGFTVGYHRGDEARPYRHMHVALVSYCPLPLGYVRRAWLSIVGPHNMKSIEVEPYCPGEGGISYQMKADGDYSCNWQLSDNIQLFKRLGDGRLHRTSTSRQRRYARRIQAQQQPAPSQARRRVGPQPTAARPPALWRSALSSGSSLRPRLRPRREDAPPATSAHMPASA